MLDHRGNRAQALPARRLGGVRTGGLQMLHERAQRIRILGSGIDLREFEAHVEAFRRALQLVLEQLLGLLVTTVGDVDIGLGERIGLVGLCLEVPESSQLGRRRQQPGVDLRRLGRRLGCRRLRLAQRRESGIGLQPGSDIGPPTLGSIRLGSSRLRLRLVLGKVEDGRVDTPFLFVLLLLAATTTCRQQRECEDAESGHPGETSQREQIVVPGGGGHGVGLYRPRGLLALRRRRDHRGCFGFDLGNARVDARIDDRCLLVRGRFDLLGDGLSAIGCGNLGLLHNPTGSFRGRLRSDLDRDRFARRTSLKARHLGVSQLQQGLDVGELRLQLADPFAKLLGLLTGRFARLDHQQQLLLQIGPRRRRALGVPVGVIGCLYRRRLDGAGDGSGRRTGSRARDAQTGALRRCGVLDPRNLGDGRTTHRTTLQRRLKLGRRRRLVEGKQFCARGDDECLAGDQTFDVAVDEGVLIIAIKRQSGLGRRRACGLSPARQPQQTRPGTHGTKIGGEPIRPARDPRDRLRRGPIDSIAARRCRVGARSRSRWRRGRRRSTIRNGRRANRRCGTLGHRGRIQENREFLDQLTGRPDDLDEKVHEGLADRLATRDTDHRIPAPGHLRLKGELRQKVIALDAGFREGIRGGERRSDGVELVGLDVEEIDLADEGLVEGGLGP